MKLLADAYGRRIDYLRISITDHCNLRCAYCTPDDNGCGFDHHRILSYEEIIRSVEAAVSLGVTKIRLTGGEPLVRKGVAQLCGLLKAIEGLESLTLTTNGVRLAEKAGVLKKAGVSRVNVSLDSLRPERFEAITGRDMLHRVLAGIRQAESAGLFPIKLNMVVMRGINDDEIEELARWTIEKPYHVRFIELMPTSGWSETDHGRFFLPAEAVLRRLGKMGATRLINEEDTFGSARLYRLPGAAGKIGIIAPVTRHFCEACNRMRLTADGLIKSCLFGRNEFDLKTVLKSGGSLEKIASVFIQAAREKPRRHQIAGDKRTKARGRVMRAIGG